MEGFPIELRLPSPFIYGFEINGIKISTERLFQLIMPNNWLKMHGYPKRRRRRK